MKCKGTSASTGEPCQRPAIHGEEFCFGHSRKHKKERDRQVAKMVRGRKKSKKAGAKKSNGHAAHRKMDLVDVFRAMIREEVHAAMAQSMSALADGWGRRHG